MSHVEPLFGFGLTQKKSLQEYLTSIGVDAQGITDLTTQISNLNAWATALATKLNADAGVTDTNYDTNPQA